MIRYKLSKNNNEKSPAYGKWYARAVTNETVDLDDLSKHMAAHNTPYSKGCIKGVIEDMVACIRELTLQGMAVKVENLAIFSVGLNNKEGADAPEEFSIAKNIGSIKLRARATGEFTCAELAKSATLKEADKYKVE